MSNPDNQFKNTEDDFLLQGMHQHDVVPQQDASWQAAQQHGAAPRHAAQQAAHQEGAHRHAAYQHDAPWHSAQQPSTAPQETHQQGAQLDDTSQLEPFQKGYFSQPTYVTPPLPETPKKRPGVFIAVVIALVLLLASVALFVFAPYFLQSEGTDNNALLNSSVSNISSSGNSGGGSQDNELGNSAAARDAMVLTLFGDRDTYVLQGEAYVEPGAHAVERKSKDISSSITVEGKVDTSRVGDYQIIYCVTSSDGLILKDARTVHVVSSMDSNTGGIPVLMYHYVYTSSDVPKNLNSNYILDSNLADQLNYLTSNDYYFPSYQELRAYIDGNHTLPTKSVVLTFDDGAPNFLAYGIPLLEKYKVPATSFIVGIDNIQPCLENASSYISYQSHSYDMHRSGGNQGHGGRISAMTQAEILTDLQKNSALLGTNDAFAYPYGDNTEQSSAAAAEAGILCAFTTKNGLVHVGDDPTKLSRIRVQGGTDLSGFISLLS